MMLLRKFYSGGVIAALLNYRLMVGFPAGMVPVDDSGVTCGEYLRVIASPHWDWVAWQTIRPAGLAAPPGRTGNTPRGTSSPLLSCRSGRHSRPTSCSLPS